MCQFKSAIVLKNKIVCPLKKDSHTEILQDLGINDDYLNATKTFVRVEMVPKDGDIFNHDLNNWQLKVDQDIKPDWFDFKLTEQQMKELHMPEVFEKCFVVDDTSWKEYKDTRLFVKNSKIKVVNSSVEASGNSSVVAWENSSVEASGNSSVVAWGNSSVEASGNSSVVARENSSVVARENSSVEASGNSSVIIPYSKSVNIKNVTGNATIKDLSGNKPKIIIANDFEIEKYKIV